MKLEWGKILNFITLSGILLVSVIPLYKSTFVEGPPYHYVYRDQYIYQNPIIFIPFILLVMLYVFLPRMRKSVQKVLVFVYIGLALFIFLYADLLAFIPLQDFYPKWGILVLIGLVLFMMLTSPTRRSQGGKDKITDSDQPPIPNLPSPE